MNINIAVIGSRTFKDYPVMEKLLDKIIHEHGIPKVTIISGGANGADTLAEQYADYRCYNKAIHKPDWKNITRKGAVIRENRYGKYDAMAGHVRNSKIIADADIVVAFHNGSPGTADSLRKAKAAKLPVYEWKY